MTKLLRPAAVFMNRLRYPAKFSLIGLMFVLPLAVVMFYFLSEVDRTIAVTSAERAGIRLYTPLMRLLEDLVSNEDAIIDGGAPVPSIDSDVAAVDAAMRSSSPGVHPAAWPRVKEGWEALRAPGSISGTSRGDAYIILITGISALIGQVGIDSKLVLDPEQATYYLMDTIVDQAPDLLVHLARSRRSADVIAGPTPRRRVRSLTGGPGKARIADILVVAEHSASIINRGRVVRLDLDQAYAADRDLRVTLRPAALDLDASEVAYHDLMDSVIDERKHALTHDAVDSASRRLSNAVDRYTASATGHLDMLLYERIRRVSVRRQTVCWLAAVSLAFAVYLFGGFYVGTLDGMRILLGTARRIAGGEGHGQATAQGSLTESYGEIGALAEGLEKMVRERTDELVEARNAAQEANVAKSRFLANMSHELRTPLNAVLGFSYLLQSDKTLGESQRETLRIINRSGEHLLTLINDVLDVARIEAGRVVVEKSPFDVMRLVRDLTDMLRQRAEEKGLDLLYDQSSRFPRFVRSDAGKVRQILTNLIGNAVKYTETGRVTVSVRSEDVTGRECTLIFDVIDTGIGIDEEDQARIFEPFIQLSTAADRKGTGLGLAITRQFIELLGGSIHVHSALGEGTRMTIYVPVELVSEADVNATFVETGVVARIAPGEGEVRVLIVEDQPENAMLLSTLLTNANFAVSIAENGRRGVEMFQSWNPHFIWMDRRMPVMDGLAAASAIRTLPGGNAVKIAGLSASALTDQREESLAAGMDDFVGKPFRPDEIFECMARLLGITYVVDDDQNAEPAPEAAVLSIETVAALPLEVRRDLLESIISLDSTRIESAIDRVREIDSGLGAVLADHARRLSYTAIVKVLSTN